MANANLAADAATATATATSATADTTTAATGTTSATASQSREKAAAYVRAYATLAAAATGIFHSPAEWTPVCLRRGKTHGKGHRKPRSRIGWLRLAVEVAIERAFGVGSGFGSGDMATRGTGMEVLEEGDQNPAPVPSMPPPPGGEGNGLALHPLWKLEMECREVSNIVRCGVAELLASAAIPASFTYEDEYPILRMESYDPCTDDNLLQWYEPQMAAETGAESGKGPGDVGSGGEGDSEMMED